MSDQYAREFVNELTYSIASTLTQADYSAPLQQSLRAFKSHHLHTLVSQQRANLLAFLARTVPKEAIKQKIKEFVKLRHPEDTANSKSQRLALLQKIREALNLKRKTKVSLQNSCDILMGRIINQPLRQLLYEQILLNQDIYQNNNSYMKDFIKNDKKTTQIPIFSDMHSQMEDVIYELKIKLFTDQRQLVSRLMESVYRKHQDAKSVTSRTGLTKPKFYLAIVVVKACETYTLAKINELGTMYYAILDRVSYYMKHYDEDTRKRQKLIMAVGLIDPELQETLRQQFQKDQKLETILMNSFFLFIQSLGTVTLPWEVAMFMIDQLLIKSLNPFDIYLMFAIVLLLLYSGQEQPSQKAEEIGLDLRLKHAKFIDLGKFVQSFNTVYEDIPGRSSFIEKQLPIDGFIKDKLAMCRGANKIKENQGSATQSQVMQILTQQYQQEHGAPKSPNLPLVSQSRHCGLLSHYYSLDEEDS